MKWYWKVRIYRPDGQYCQGVIETDRVLMEIDLIKDFYEEMTGCKMLLEGMADGLSLLTWEHDTFAYADSYDEALGRYRGLRAGANVNLNSAAVTPFRAGSPANTSDFSTCSVSRSHAAIPEACCAA